MKFEFNWPKGFWENYVLIYWWDSNMSDLGWRVKGQVWPFELIYSHCLIRLNISSDYNDFGFNSFQKKTSFQKNTHLNALNSVQKLCGTGFWQFPLLCVILGPTSLWESYSWRPPLIFPAGSGAVHASGKALISWEKSEIS